MKSKRTRTAAALGIAAAALLMQLLIVTACDQGAPATPTFPVAEASASICPQIDPTFASIRGKLLDTNTCGSVRSNCHSASATLPSPPLDYSADASALYFELLGDGGSKAFNVSGDEKSLLRVVPGDAGASFLYIKLITKSGSDQHYGSGMPFDYPGQLCPSAVDAVKTWIDNGARFEEPDASDAGDGSIEDADVEEASSDADVDGGD